MIDSQNFIISGFKRSEKNPDVHVLRIAEQRGDDGVAVIKFN
jgi:hypothetical protein